MENNQADGFRQLEEECREMAKRASWINEALPRPRNGMVETERKLTNACQYVESALEELRDVVRRGRELEAAFLAAQTTAAERDEAAASAAAKTADAERRMAAAGLKAVDAAKATADANLKAAAAEASMKAYDKLKRQLEEEREATRKEKQALDIRVKEAREVERKAKSLERQRAEAERDVARFNVIRDELVTGKDDLKRERETLEKDIAEYNKAAAEYSQLKSKMAEELRQEKARVGRRDETIARLKQDIGQRDQNILRLEADHNAQMREKEHAISNMTLAEMHVRMSSEYNELARKMDEMQISQGKTQESLTNLPPNTMAVKGLEKQVDDMKKQVEDMKQQLQKTEAAYSARQRDEAAAAEQRKVALVHEIDSQTRKQHEEILTRTKQGYETQLHKLCTAKEEELAGVRRQLGTQLEELRKTKEEELTDARRRCESQLELRKTKEEELTDARRRCESQLEELRTMEEDLADARKQFKAQLEELRTTKGELAKSSQLYGYQLKQLHTTKGELADVRQQFNTQMEELRTTKEELASARQQLMMQLKELGTTKEESASARRRSENEINAAQKRVSDLQLVVDQLRQELDNQGPSASPGPKRKKPRAEDSQPRPQSPPPSAPKGECAMGTDVAKWQAAQQSASQFWSSFEPRLFDPSDDLSYEVLLHSLRKAARDEATRSRFMAFLQSDITGGTVSSGLSTLAANPPCSRWRANALSRGIRRQVNAFG